MYRVSLIIAILLFHQHYFSQILFDQGATSTAICGANVTQTDVWSINNNIGSLAKIESISLGVSINNRFLISDFSTGALAFVLPLKKILGKKVKQSKEKGDYLRWKDIL